MTKTQLSHLIDKYDRPDGFLVISIYPKRKETYSTGKSGVSSYTKNVISKMNKRSVILCEYTDKPSIYEEGKTLVIRCFKNDSITMYRELFGWIRKFHVLRKILVQYDFSLYGSVIVNGTMMPFLSILKLFGYQTYITLHHVVTDINKLSGHVGLTNSLFDHQRAKLYNAFFRMFYKTLDAASTAVIVLEYPLKDKLLNYIPDQKIFVIPHGVDTTLTSIANMEARRQLKLPLHKHVVLFFGYINWFKGADLFASYFKNVTKLLGKPAKFIIAGGESPTLKNHAYYQTYYKHTKSIIEKSKAVTITGYIPQEKIGLYFSAADIIILPYRHFMTASGVMSLILSYRKPFIISKELGTLFTGPDFQEGFKETQLTQNDVTFDLNKSSCIAKTEEVLADGLKRKMALLADTMRNKRSYEKTAQLYENLLFIPAYQNASATIHRVENTYA